MSKHLTSLCFAVLLLTTAVQSQPLPGSIDSSFATNGLFVYSYFRSWDTGIFVQNNKRIIVAGTAGYYHTTLIGLNRFGGFDDSFGIRGISHAFSPIGQSGGGFLNMIFDESAIYCTGSSLLDFNVSRIFWNGTPDYGFADSSVKVFRYPGSTRNTAICLQPDNKIVLGGETQDRLSILRINADGSNDSTFNKGQMLNYNDPTGMYFNTDATGLHVAKDGTIWASGSVEIDSSLHYALTLMKVLPNGVFDSSYGYLGARVEDVTTSNYAYARGECMAVQPDGKMIVGGFSINKSTGSDLVLLRYLPDGSRDSSFGDNGLLMPLLDGYENAESITLDSKGNIIIGWANYLARFRPNGSLDSSFGVNGFVRDVPLTQVYGMAVQEDDRILATGYVGTTQNDDRKFAVVRYHGGELPKPPPGGDTGKTVQYAVYPNPNKAAGILYIKSSENLNNATLNLYDAIGRQVSNYALQSLQGTTASIELPNLAFGLYTVRIVTAMGLVLQPQKLVITSEK